MPAPTISAAESVQDNLVTAMTNITAANSYRTTVVRVAESLFVTSVESPSIAVVMQGGQIRGSDANEWYRDALDNFLQFMIVGYVYQADMEKLLHDIKRAVMAVATTYVQSANSDGYRWQVDPRVPMNEYRDPFPDDGGYVNVGVDFQVRIIALAPATL